MSAEKYKLADESVDNHRRDVSTVAKSVTRSFDEFFHVEVNGDGEFTVFSGSGNIYTVDLPDGTCTCPDSRKGPWCKHAFRVAFVTGVVPDIDGVVPTENAEKQANGDTNDDNDESDGDTFAERVEQFAADNPDVTAVEVVGQLEINPSEIDRVEKILS